MHGRKRAEIYENRQQTLWKYQRICITEAQATAHLLHHLTGKEDLVNEFPWWQMISCLVCAGSILLVASALGTENCLEEDIEVTTLEEDAQTCLKVFEALSANSAGAKAAGDMLMRLRHRETGSSRDSALQAQNPGATGGSQIQTTEVLPGPAMPTFSDISNEDLPRFDFLDSGFDYQDWPSEILDSMNWSAQFFATVQRPHLE